MPCPPHWPRDSRRSLRCLNQGGEAIRCVSRKSRLVYCVDSRPTGRSGTRRDRSSHKEAVCTARAAQTAIPRSGHPQQTLIRDTRRTWPQTA